MIHVLLRYLGIKTKLLASIKKEIKRITPPNGCVLDMFAGSNIVGQSLLHEFKVFSNDIQKYSYVVSKATIEINENFNYSKLNWKKIENSIYFKENNEKLSSLFEEPLKYEKNLFNRLQNERNIELLIEFKNYYDNTPYPGFFDEKKVNKSFKKLGNLYSIEYYKNASNDKNFYKLFSLAYACPYFSLSQSIFIDSYRYALDKMYYYGNINETEYNIYLSCLIYYLGNIVTSVGDHFAQPEKLKLLEEKKFKKEIDKIIIKKTMPIDECFDKIQNEFKKIIPFNNNNKSFCCDYKKLFEKENEEIMAEVDTIYIDPPYTNAHYSRFYHILETIVLYDYPGLEFFGRYRNDRYQSPFCVKSKALCEFDYMINKCSVAGKNLVISYSDTKQCIVPREDLILICKKYYKNVDVNEIDYQYRNFGQKPNKVKGNELLIVCEV